MNKELNKILKNIGYTERMIEDLFMSAWGISPTSDLIFEGFGTFSIDRGQGINMNPDGVNPGSHFAIMLDCQVCESTTATLTGAYAFNSVFGTEIMTYNSDHFATGIPTGRLFDQVNSVGDVLISGTYLKLKYV